MARVVRVVRPGRAFPSTFLSPSFLLRVSEHKPVPASWYPAPLREVWVVLWDPDAPPHPAHLKTIPLPAG